jgi:hypothetical protein
MISAISGLIAIVFLPISALYVALFDIPIVATVMKLMMLLFIFPAELANILHKLLFR